MTKTVPEFSGFASRVQEDLVVKSYLENQDAGFPLQKKRTNLFFVKE